VNARGTVEDAIDDLRKKFGNAAVIRGIAYDGPEKAG
jgi:DNA polymerase-4